MRACRRLRGPEGRHQRLHARQNRQAAQTAPCCLRARRRSAAAAAAARLPAASSSRSPHLPHTRLRSSRTWRWRWRRLRAAWTMRRWRRTLPPTCSSARRSCTSGWRPYRRQAPPRSSRHLWRSSSSRKSGRGAAGRASAAEVAADAAQAGVSEEEMAAAEEELARLPLLETAAGYSQLAASAAAGGARRTLLRLGPACWRARSPRPRSCWRTCSGWPRCRHRSRRAMTML